MGNVGAMEGMARRRTGVGIQGEGSMDVSMTKMRGDGGEGQWIPRQQWSRGSHAAEICVNPMLMEGGVLGVNEDR